MPSKILRSKRFSAIFALLLCCRVSWAQQPSAHGVDSSPEIVVAVTSEDAQGVTQEALNLDVLRELERRTLSTFRRKMADYQKSQGNTGPIPIINSEAHYVQANAVKLAVVRLRAPGSVNAVFAFGIVGPELRRVVCTRTANLEQSIPVFYGPCGDKMRETYGISLQPR